MTVEDIIKEKIRISGADGLVLLEMDGCGCDLEDLMPCGGENVMECRLARKVKCDGECNHDEDLDYHYEPLRPARIGQTPAREHPCGCVVCVCEDERQCHGCGAKSCGTPECVLSGNKPFEEK